MFGFAFRPAFHFGGKPAFVGCGKREVRALGCHFAALFVSEGHFRRDKAPPEALSVGGALKFLHARAVKNQRFFGTCVLGVDGPGPHEGVKGGAAGER